MNSLFFAMLAGHLVADFWFQPESWVSHKKEYGWKSGKLLIHSFIAALIPVLFVLNLKLWWFIPVIFLTHYLIDILKSFVKENILFFLIDQALHIGILALLAAFFSESAMPENLLRFWIYACGFVLVTNPLGIFTGMFLKSVTRAKSQTTKPDVSAWIGIMERILIVLLWPPGNFRPLDFWWLPNRFFVLAKLRKTEIRKLNIFYLER